MTGGLALAAMVGAAIVLVALGALDLVRLVDGFGVVLVLVALGFFVWLFLGVNWTRAERGRLIVIVVLFLAATIFWGGYEQAGSSLNLFASEHTTRSFGGEEVLASYFQSVPAFFVIVLSVVFTVLWTVLGRRQPSSPGKFALGLIFLGLGFVVMMLAASRIGVGSKVGPEWLIATYFLHVMGELCLSPIGLSAVTKLAPERVTSLMMGVWFLASSVGSYFAGRAAGYSEFLSLGGLFAWVAAISIASGVILAVFIKPIRGRMDGVR